MIAPFWSVVPYVANASVVAGVHTGNDISAASLNLPEETAIWKRAVPALTVETGKRTSARSLALTTTRLPAEVARSFTHAFPPVVPPARLALVALIATSTAISLSVWFWITTGRSTLSPKFINRGALGRTINGCFAVIVDSLFPNRLAVSTETAVIL